MKKEGDEEWFLEVMGKLNVDGSYRFTVLQTDATDPIDTNNLTLNLPMLQVLQVNRCYKYRVLQSRRVQLVLKNTGLCLYNHLRKRIREGSVRTPFGTELLSI